MSSPAENLLWNAVETQMPAAGGVKTSAAASHIKVSVIEILVRRFHWFFISNRDDQNVQDDRGEAAGADASGAQTDAPQLHEHSEGAATCPHIRCVCECVCVRECLVGRVALGVNAGH